jgi:hypothetical protein
VYLVQHLMTQNQHGLTKAAVCSFCPHPLPPAGVCPPFSLPLPAPPPPPRSPHLNALPADLDLMTGLQSLRLQGTPTSLAVIPDSISALGQLQDLRLHGCHLLQVRVFSAKIS